VAAHVWKDLLESGEEEELAKQQDAGGMSKPLQKGGVLRDPLSQAYVKRFFISVTEEEFSRGLLWVSEHDQVIACI
jgi:hypothetical protein